MSSCEITSAVTAIACSIAKDKTDDELNLLSAIFTQLGDTLATIVVSRGINNKKCEKDNNFYKQ